MCGLVFAHMKAQGGVPAYFETNQRKAQHLYATIDNSGGFYNSPVAVKDRHAPSLNPTCPVLAAVLAACRVQRGPQVLHRLPQPLLLVKYRSRAVLGRVLDPGAQSPVSACCRLNSCSVQRTASNPAMSIRHLSRLRLASYTKSGSGPQSPDAASAVDEYLGQG